MLPAEPNPLIGRAIELDRVAADLAMGRRLITITGPVGMGKTRVARAAARACRWPVVAVDLGAATGEDELVASVAEALAVGLAPHGDAATWVGDALAGRGDLLLLLDPFEAVVEAAPVLAAWLAAAPGLRVLVASRVRLRLAAEGVHPLGPLPEALALFAERARAVWPEFEVDDDARALVARLDGLPLALEFAAARAALVGSRALLERLDLESLGADRRDVPARQATLRGALEARVVGSQAILAHERGAADDAQILYEQALRVLRRVGDARAEAILVSNLGDLHLEQGRPAEARARYGRAEALLDALGDARVAGVVRGNLGAVALDEGRAEEAEALRREAVAAMGRVGDRRMEAVFRGYHGVALHALGRGEAARAAYDGAVAGVEGRFAALFAAHRAVLDLEGGGDLGAAEAALDGAAQGADSALAAVVAVHRGHGALRRGDAEGARTCLATVGSPSDDLRFARRRLAAALDADLGGPSVAPLRLSAHGAVPPDGPAIDLERRPTLRRVLDGLVLRRRTAPGQPMDLEALLAAGWPGERVQPQAAANRVYVAIATLRKLGLRDVILSREDGYLLDPEVPLEDAE